MEGAGVRVANVSYPTAGIAQFFQISNVGRVDPGRVHIGSHTGASAPRRAYLHPHGGTQIRTRTGTGICIRGDTRRFVMDGGIVAELTAISVPDPAGWLFLVGLLAAGSDFTPT
jgi:hypothetical protein